MNIGAVGGTPSYVSPLQSGPNAAQQAQIQDQQQQQQASQQAGAGDEQARPGTVTETRGNNLNIVV
ncbi:hypothetical protein [Azospirillum halopraeferens]|uniref:hypothetical protein n=1 Tax=Azospirillum halopraeferens TaxID=34010 RepID=UPI0003F901C1|nr:hypothetical protein [Azospirillum halopraeferens]